MVKPIETAESLPGSTLVLLGDTRRRWTGQQCEVLAVGFPELCLDEDCSRPHSEGHTHPTALQVGDWLLVRPRSYTPTDEPEHWLIRQEAALARFVA